MRAAACLLPALGIWGLCRYLPIGVDMTHRTVWWLLWAAFAYLGDVALKADRRLRRYGLIVGAWYLLAQLCGERLGMAQTIASSGWDFLWLLIAVLGLAPGMGGLVVRLFQWLTRQRPSAAMDGRKVFLGSTCILLVCWLPYLLAFYPGLFTYDIGYQYLMYTSGNFSTHHPLIHTLMMGLFCDLGKALFGYPVKGILMYTVVQMVLMAMAQANAIRVLSRLRAPRWTCLLMLILGCVMPFHTLLSISATKDTLFAGAVLTLCVMVAQCVIEPAKLRKPWWLVGFILTGMMVGMLRNNGFICLIAVVLIGLLMWKWPLKRLIALGLCMLMLSSCGMSALKFVTHAEDGSMSEMLSVPIQQLARAYNVTDDPARDEILSYLENAPLYSPTISDFVKNVFKPTAEDLPGFFKLWAEVGLRHPVVYLDAFGLTTRGFYHLDELPAGQYLETAFHEDEAAWIVEDSKWPWLNDLMDHLYSQNRELEIPLFSAILSTAFWCWAMLIILVYALYRRSYPGMAAGFISLLLFLTALLGPCVMLRYIYPTILAVPFLLGVTLIRNEA